MTSKIDCYFKNKPLIHVSLDKKEWMNSLSKSIIQDQSPVLPIFLEIAPLDDKIGRGYINEDILDNHGLAVEEVLEPLNLELHNDKGHAVKYSTGDTFYFCNNKLHNEKGPACIWMDGNVRFFFHGKLHNDKGPSRIFPDGRAEFYCHGKLHNDKGPACIWPHGRAEFYSHGKLHRLFGYARIDGYGNGKRFIYGHEINWEKMITLMCSLALGFLIVSIFLNHFFY